MRLTRIVGTIEGLPCVSTGADVNSVPRVVCMVGVGVVEAQARNDTARRVSTTAAEPPFPAN